MIKDASISLWEACKDKPLFKNILEEIVCNTSSDQLFDVIAYCYEQYSDIHPDILLDVFTSQRQKNSNLLQAQVDTTVS